LRRQNPQAAIPHRSTMASRRAGHAGKSCEGKDDRSPARHEPGSY